MIDIKKIKAGDVVVLRDGRRKVVTKNATNLGFCIGGLRLNDWHDNGRWHSNTGKDTDFDIIRVEPKEIRKYTFYFAFNNMNNFSPFSITTEIPNWGNVRKITISEDGSEDKIERV